MITAPKPIVHLALYEGEGSEPLAAPVRFELIRTLLEKGYAVRPFGPAASQFTGGRFPDRPRAIHRPDSSTSRERRRRRAGLFQRHSRAGNRRDHFRG